MAKRSKPVKKKTPIKKAATKKSAKRSAPKKAALKKSKPVKKAAVKKAAKKTAPKKTVTKKSKPVVLFGRNIARAGLIDFDTGRDFRDRHFPPAATVFGGAGMGGIDHQHRRLARRAGRRHGCF